MSAFRSQKLRNTVCRKL